MSNPPEGDREKIAREAIERVSAAANRIPASPITGSFRGHAEVFWSGKYTTVLTSDLRAILAALTPVVGSSREPSPTTGDALVGAPREEADQQRRLDRAKAALDIATDFIQALPIPTRGATKALIQMEDALSVGPLATTGNSAVTGTGEEGGR